MNFFSGLGLISAGVSSGGGISTSMSTPGSAQGGPTGAQRATFDIPGDCYLATEAGGVSLNLDDAHVGFMTRVQLGLNELNVLPEPVALTGQWDYATRFAWAAFVAKYAQWVPRQNPDPFGPPGGTYIGADPGRIECGGLELLQSALADKRMTDATAFSPIDQTPPSRSVTLGPLVFVERSLLWVLAPGSRQALAASLRLAVPQLVKTTPSVTFYRFVRSSGKPPAGQDALTLLMQMIGSGKACMIRTASKLGGAVGAAFTDRPQTVATNCSSGGSAWAAAHQGQSFSGSDIGIVGGGGASTTLDGAQPPDPSTGLPAWGLWSGDPAAVVDAARRRAIFMSHWTPGSLPGSGAPGGGTIGGGSGGGNGLPPSPSPYTGGPTPPGTAPPPASGAPSWALPVAAVAGLGLAAYLVLGME